MEEYNREIERLNNEIAMLSKRISEMEESERAFRIREDEWKRKEREMQRLVLKRTRELARVRDLLTYKVEEKFRDICV
jgi:Skp family chaperone for outer membrane proteins